MPAQTVIKLRRDTSANWTSADSVLAAGELGIETDTNRIKIGDGATEWTGLRYGPVGDELAIRVKNASGSVAIPAGRLVQFAGAAGDTVTASPAVTDGSVDFHLLIGVTATEIAADGFGDVIITGVVGGLNTSAYTAGTLLYADDANPGQLTNVVPTAPSFGEPVAAVTRSGAGTSGLILVRLNLGSSLSDIHDVDITSATSGEVLQFDGTNWVNAAIDALPDQTGESGNYLTTDGTNASWATLDIPPGTVVSDTAPSSPDVGQLWWNSADGTLYIYYDGFWVEAVTGVTGPAGADGADGVDGVDGGFDSTQTIESGTTRALTSADAGKLITNSGAITITVEGLTTGQQVDFVQTNAAQITFVAGSGVTLNSKDGNLKTAAQYSPASVKCLATNTYILVGDLGA